ncbi:MAG: 30S ribosomal protein S15 [Mycoplasmoidaceae bacterium]
MAVSKETKKNLVKEYGKNPKDTGNTEVQIAILTAEINSLTDHLKNNQKDFASKRTLYAKNSKRRNLLNYLKRVDVDKYRELVKKLNLRSSN